MKERLLAMSRMLIECWTSNNQPTAEPCRLITDPTAALTLLCRVVKQADSNVGEFGGGGGGGDGRGGGVNTDQALSQVQLFNLLTPQTVF